MNYPVLNDINQLAMGVRIQSEDLEGSQAAPYLPVQLCCREQRLPIHADTDQRDRIERIQRPQSVDVGQGRHLIEERKDRPGRPSQLGERELLGRRCCQPTVQPLSPVSQAFRSKCLSVNDEARHQHPPSHERMHTVSHPANSSPVILLGECGQLLDGRPLKRPLQPAAAPAQWGDDTVGRSAGYLGVVVGVIGCRRLVGQGDLRM